MRWPWRPARALCRAWCAVTAAKGCCLEGGGGLASAMSVSGGEKGKVWLLVGSDVASVDARRKTGAHFSVQAGPDSSCCAVLPLGPGIMGVTRLEPSPLYSLTLTVPRQELGVGLC